MNLNIGKSIEESSCIGVPIEEFLNKEDYDYYKKLKSTLSSQICRNCRNRRTESFNEVLLTIRYFVNRNTDEAWKRSLICGICWYKNYICLNIKQMSILLEKCRSSINGSFQRLYYSVLHNKQQTIKILIEAIPYFKKNRGLLHLWSVREQKMTAPVMTAFPFQMTKQIQKNETKSPKPKADKAKKDNLISIAKPNNSINMNNKVQINSEPIKSDNNENTQQMHDLYVEIYSSEEILGKDNIF